MITTKRTLHLEYESPDRSIIFRRLAGGKTGEICLDPCAERADVFYAALRTRAWVEGLRDLCNAVLNEWPSEQ